MIDLEVEISAKSKKDAKKIYERRVIMNRENVKSIEEAPSGLYLTEHGDAVAKFGGGLQLSLSWSRDVSKRSIACLYIKELQEKLKLSETIPEGAKVKEPSMVLCFDDVRSVDLVIDALQRIKKRIKRIIKCTIMNDYQLTIEQIDNMQHAIGYKPYNVVNGVLEYYRNFYGCRENKGWNDLVKKGLATKREDPIFAGDYVYHLTSNGIDVLSKICKCKFVERR